jgi:microcystin-dependent protein
MASGSTSRKKIPFPKPTDADKICSDWESTAKTLDEVNEGQADWLQAGVVAATDWSLTGNINSGTGALGSTGNTGNTAWLPDPVVSGALMRSVTTPATLSGIAPSLLPSTTKYVSCAYELTPSTWGAKATVTAHSGEEKATQAEAEAAPPATTAGKIQVRRVVIKNTTGVYSIVAQEDVRRSSEAIYKPGDLKPSAVSSPQFGWLLCDGSAKSRVGYASLYAAIGTAFGVGDGSTTFNLPEGTGRTLIGTGEASGAAGATSHALGSKGGEEKHTISIGEMPAHSHTGTTGNTNLLLPDGSGGHIKHEAAFSYGAQAGYTATDNLLSPGHTHGISSEGGGGSHNNLQPFFTGNWFIKY